MKGVARPSIKVLNTGSMIFLLLLHIKFFLLENNIHPFWVILPLVGQHTNSTPEKSEIPHGRSMAKLRSERSLSWQLCAAVWFQRSNSQQRVWLWMWSKRQFSGTSRASLWNGPSAMHRATGLPTIILLWELGLLLKALGSLSFGSILFHFISSIFEKFREDFI